MIALIDRFNHFWHQEDDFIFPENIEIKANKKSYPTKEQKEWVAYLNDAGYYAKVVKGLDECIEVVDWYLKIP